jgi:hypothetical protein
MAFPQVNTDIYLKNDYSFAALINKLKILKRAQGNLYMISSSYIELYSIKEVTIKIAGCNKEKLILDRYSELTSFRLIKEKSWSVRIVEGQLLDGKVRATQCSECKRSCELVTVGCGNSNSMLYGCTENKCRHVLIHFKFGSGFLQ